MIFSDRSIREAIEGGVIIIDPYEPSFVQPSSVDLRVGNGFRVFVNHRYSQIDPQAPQSDLTQLIEVEAEEPFMLHPGEFVLGSTLERVKLGDDVVARLEGKSSLGRLGLLIHSTAGFIDPGFEGHITLEPLQRRNPPHRHLSRDEDRSDQLLSDDNSDLPISPTAPRSWARSIRARAGRPPAAPTRISTDRTRTSAIVPTSIWPRSGRPIGIRDAHTGFLAPRPI